MADLATLRRAHPAGLTGGVGREVVVVHVALAASPGDSVSSFCSILSMFSVVTPRIWVSPRSNSAEPWTRGITSTSAEQRPDVGEAAAVDADLVAQHALAHQLLGQRAEAPRRSPSRGPRTAAASFSAASVLDAVERGSRAPACRRWCSAAARSARRRPRRRRTRRPRSRGRPGSPRVGLAACLASSACASQSCLMNGLAASRPLATTSSVGAWRRRATRSKVCSVASASTIMIATSPSRVTRPATTMSKTASLELAVRRERHPLAARSGRRGRRRPGRRTAGRRAGWTSTRR